MPDDQFLLPDNLLDEESLNKIILNPPFFPVEGLVNLRDALPSSQSTIFPGRITKPLCVFRSGELTKVTKNGKTQLARLGIKKVFDSRSDFEVEMYQVPLLNIGGIEVVKCPVIKDPVSMSDRLASFAADQRKAFIALYMMFLQTGGPAVELILRHLRNHPDEPCLLHCTGGKDRTGVFVAVIQLLLGVDDAAILKDYELTTYGLQPLYPTLMARFKSNEVYRRNWSGLLNLASSRSDNFCAFLDAFRDTFGDVETYVKRYTTLNDGDIHRIRENLLLPADSLGLEPRNQTNGQTRNELDIRRGKYISLQAKL